MNIYQFLLASGRQSPLIAVQGDIFSTPADHIAFAVHWPNDAGFSDNDNGGFSSKVVNHGWQELAYQIFEKGEVRSKVIKGKTFHAMAVHTPQDGGWEESPLLIEQCLNKIPVSSDEVIACVLIGGGHAGHKYKAGVDNIEGMMRSYKRVVLHVYDAEMYDKLIALGIAAQPIPLNIPLSNLPKPLLFRDKQAYEQYMLESAG